MGDQLVIYQAMAAAAQVGIILAAGFASFATFKALDKLGITNAGKGMINRGKQWGKQVADNSGWRRGRETRKAAKKAVKDERYARNPVRRRIAGGFMPTEAGRRGREAVQLNAQRTVRQHEAQEAEVIAEQWRRQGGRAIEDDTLRDVARTHADAAHRRAAATLLAQNGRVNMLRQLRDDPGQFAENAEMLNEVITGNSGKIYGKAPDLNPGNPHPFAGVSAADVTGWHHSTLRQAFASDEGDNVRAAFDEAYNNPNLRGNIDTEMLARYQEAFGAGPPTIAPPAAPAGAGGAGVLNIPHAGPAMPLAQPIVVPPGVANPNPGNATPVQPVQQQRAAGGNFGGGPGANLPPVPPPAGGGTAPPWRANEPGIPGTPGAGPRPPSPPPGP